MKDSEECEWHYKYLKKHVEKYSKQDILDPNISINQPALEISPISTEETYHLIYAIYDTCPLSLEARKLLKNKLNKAYSQRNNNKTLHDTLDLIIRQAHEQTINNKPLS